MKIAFSLLAALLWSGLASAQDIDLRTTPGQVVVGEPFVVRLGGRFPTPCSLDGTISAALSDGLLNIELDPAAEPCPQVVTELDRAFGPFRIESDAADPGDTIEVVFSDPTGEFGRTQVEVVDSVNAETGFRAGVYWDPEFSGNGFALEFQGDEAFLAAFTYDETGMDQWFAEVGRVEKQAFEGLLREFSGGDCVVCGDAGAMVMQAGDSGSFQIVFAGGAEAFLTFGQTPGRALHLIPFSLREVDSEGTIAGETFRMPDLSGRWLFVATESGASALVTELAVMPSGISDSGIAFFASADRSVLASCSERQEERFVCEVSEAGETLFTAPASGIAHDEIRAEGFVGLRLD